MRRMALVIVILAITLGLLSAGFAEQTLTLTLDPAQGQPQKSSEKDLRLKHETLGATRTNSQKEYKAQVQSPDKSGQKEIPIGRVGVLTAKTSIRSTPNKRGRTLYTCPKDTCLAIVGENGKWYGVLMVDSSTGWVEKSKVKLLNYQVLAQSPQSTGKGSGVVNTALKYLGIPYKWGGYSFGGLDCSGFVKAVFESHGIHLPRVSRDQALVGTPIGWKQLQAGDRLYFACKGGQIDHAGIYIGNGLFIHSSTRNGGVAVDNLLTPFYANSLVAARRS